MRLVTLLTGLSADTVRAWERRYAAVKPARTGGNTRRYSSAQLRRLLLLREATRRGHSIGSIASLSDAALDELVASDRPGIDVLVNLAARQPEEVHQLCDAYIGSLARFDTREGFDILRQAAAVLERRFFVEEVLVHVMADVKRKWTSAVGASQQQVFLHHLHALVQCVVPSVQTGRSVLGSPSVPVADFRASNRARVLVGTSPIRPKEAEALAAAFLVAGTSAECIYVGATDEQRWAMEMSGAEAMVWVSDRPMVDEPPGIFTFDPDSPRAMLRNWVDLEEMVKRLSRAA